METPQKPTQIPAISYAIEFYPVVEAKINQLQAEINSLLEDINNSGQEENEWREWNTNVEIPPRIIAIERLQKGEDLTQVNTDLVDNLENRRKLSLEGCSIQLTEEETIKLEKLQLEYIKLIQKI